MTTNDLSLRDSSGEPPSTRMRRLFEAHDAVDYATLIERAGLAPRTLDRTLSELVAAGELHRWVRGVYSRRPLATKLNYEGEELLGTLQESDADAHITGFDVLAPYAHQFSYGYTHLVYCHPLHLDRLGRDLSAEDWMLLPAGRHVHLGGPHERMVILRGQTHDPRRYPVRDHLALPEKAWVDLLREVRRSRLELDYGELGRILRSLERAGIPLDKLRTYARNTGYQNWVDAAFGTRLPDSLAQAQLAAGYQA